jgi:hypothetical protein
MRKDQIFNHLNEKNIDKEIYGVLERLSFREFSSLQVPDWEIFTRENPREFTGIYEDKKHKDKRFLVESAYSNIEIPKKDLEHISNYFNRNWLKKIVETEEFSFFSGLTFGCISGLYYVTGNQDPTALLCGIPMVLGGALLGGLSSTLSERISNRYRGSKLSKEAETYNYGESAERKLKEEYTFEKIKSGELTKQDFLALRGDTGED